VSQQYIWINRIKGGIRHKTSLGINVTTA